jgi:hypothetical protein
MEENRKKGKEKNLGRRQQDHRATSERVQTEGHHELVAIAALEQARKGELLQLHELEAHGAPKRSAQEIGGGTACGLEQQLKSAQLRALEGARQSKVDRTHAPATSLLLLPAHGASIGASRRNLIWRYCTMKLSKRIDTTRSCGGRPLASTRLKAEASIAAACCLPEVGSSWE